MTHRKMDAVTMDSWTVTDAKARFRELIDKVGSNGPQTITRRARAAVVVISVAEWERKTKRIGNLADFFAASPLRGSKLKIARFSADMVPAFAGTAAFVSGEAANES